MEKQKAPYFRMFRRNKSGATAVEFGLVAVPFIFLLMSLLEVGLHFFTTLDIEFAVEESARLVRTGQSQGDSAAQFKNKVCTKVSVLSDCASSLKIEIQSFDDFQAMKDYLATSGEPQQVDEDGNPTGQLKDTFPYDQGAGGSVVLVRAFYVWNDYSLIPGFGPSELAGSGVGIMEGSNDKLIQAATTFRNEPF